MPVRVGTLFIMPENLLFDNLFRKGGGPYGFTLKGSNII
jgi:hypothetical protein